MSDSQVLYNCKDGILAAGFDLEGNLVPAQFAPTMEFPGTLQMNCDVVHTKDTYKGDDEYIIDFFNRDETHPEYGVLYTEENKHLLINVDKLRPHLLTPFADIVETPHQASLAHRITSAILSGTIGLNKEGFDANRSIREISETLAPLRDDIKAEETEVVALQNMVVSTNRDDVKVDTYLWFCNSDGIWWHDHILPPEIITATSLCSLKPTHLDIKVSMIANIPEEVKGVFYVVTILQSRSQNLVTNKVTMTKCVAKQVDSPLVDMENDNVLHQE